MILVDTSVLIDYLKGTVNRKADIFQDILNKRVPYGINNFIFQEVLQGARNKHEYDKLREYLRSLPFYYLKNGKDSFEKAAYAHFLCRRTGVTIGSTIDLLIAQTVVENNLYLLHNDKDFDSIAKIMKDLRVYPTTFFIS